MSYTPPKESYAGSVYPVTLGAGDATVTFGGENVLMFNGFEGETPNKPVIACEIQDVPPTDWPETVAKPYADVRAGEPDQEVITSYRDYLAEAMVELIASTENKKEKDESGTDVSFPRTCLPLGFE